MALVCSIASLETAAQLTENFNSRPGVSLNNVKAHLQQNCWTFSEFAISDKNWKTDIEGDGAMVSGQSSSPNKNYNILTPVLDVPASLTVGFKYAFSNVNGNGHIRYLTIYLADANNQPVERLDSLVLQGKKKDELYAYNKTFNSLTPGKYKVFIHYGGTGIATRIAIDAINISANMHYQSGCNSAPVAVNDIINGHGNRSASGFICANDSDPDGDEFYPVVVTNSAHGSVTINADNSFSFQPNPGFSGSSTTFTYRVCETGPGALCSNEATVQINFPVNAMLPVSLVDFSGTYRGDGNVLVSWVTNFESNSDRFDIERSMDGKNWEKAGTLKAKGMSTTRQNYSFTDNVGKNNAIKKDLYYRLVQVDLDGTTSLSRILVVRVYNTKAVNTVSVTPNPAKNDIAVFLELHQSAVVTLRIMNNSGMEVQRKIVRANGGSNSFLIDGSSKLRPGMYILEVIVNSKERMVVKLIKE